MKSRPLTLSRRRVLRGAGGACLALPLSALEGPALGAGSPYPTRLIVIYTPDGGASNEGGGWGTTGAESSPVLGPSLRPLESLKSDLIFLTGIDNKAAAASANFNSHHWKGWNALLTGVKALGRDGESGSVGGISIDQYIAAKVASKPFPSIDLALFPLYGSIASLGPNRRVAPESSPQRAYDRFLAGIGPVGATPDPVAERLRLSRRAVVDDVAKELGTLSRKLPVEDRMKLENYAESMFQLSQELKGFQATCSKSAPPPAANNTYKHTGAPTNNPDIPIIGKAFMDILVKALACNLTRVGTMAWLNIVSHHIFSWIPGITKEHHLLSHGKTGTADSDMYVKTSAWFAEQFAYFVRALKAVPEGAGTMLDNTIVVWTSEHGWGAYHTYTEWPFTLAGRGGGYFRTGRHVRVPGRTTNDVCVNIANAMGVPITTFGEASYSTGAISALRG